MRKAKTLVLWVGTILFLTCSGSAQTPRPESDNHNLSPIVASLSPSVKTIVLPCSSPDTTSLAGNCPAKPDTKVQLTTTTSNPNHDSLRHIYKANAGVVIGEGAKVIWDLGGVGPGTYNASVEKYDGFGGIAIADTTVTITECPDCAPTCGLCPTISSSCPEEVDYGNPIIFTANVGTAVPSVTSYIWTVSAGAITSGQGTTSITVSTDGIAGQNVTATLEVSGIDAVCGRTTSCTTAVRPIIDPVRKFDEYGALRFSDEKARLDNFAIQLQNEPSFVGYVIGYGTCGVEGLTRANRARNYVVKTRGLDSNRVVVVDGGCRPDLIVTLWVQPLGASPPQPETLGAITSCAPCEQKSSRRRATSRRR